MAFYSSNYPPLWCNSNLNNPIQLILKEVVSFFNILQLVAVGDQRGSIDLTCFNEGKNLSAVAAIDTAGFEGQIFAVHLRQGQGLGLVVESHHRDDGIGPGAFPGQAEGVLFMDDSWFAFRSI